MFISQTGLTYFYKWPITCEILIQILNLIKCGSGICNQCDQRLFLLVSFALQRAFGTRVSVHLYCKLKWLSYPVTSRDQWIVVV
jgi:hypothetical protein